MPLKENFCDLHVMTPYHRSGTGRHHVLLAPGMMHAWQVLPDCIFCVMSPNDTACHDQNLPRCPRMVAN